MTTTTMDPANRRRLKFEEMLKRHAQKTLFLSQPTIISTSTTSRYATYCASVEGVVCKLDVPKTTPQAFGGVSSVYISPFSYYVERVLDTMIYDEVVFDKIYDTVRDEVELHAGLIAHDNFPTYEEDIDDDGKGYQDAWDNEVENCISRYSHRAARFAESHIGMAATFIDNAIESYYDSSTCVDIMDVLDIVSETISGIITKKILDMIQETLAETVFTLYVKMFPTNYMSESILNDIDSDAKLAALSMVDDICLVVDDTLTTLTVRAFIMMCDLAVGGRATKNTTTAYEVAMENVAQEMSEMQI